ncbi:hypothetical protein D9Q98_001128 [Chlorella vulgaris]|uniref:Protein DETOXIFICATION n=1 Tax=Chlorella vulgaris TaxID=3077 RepID=A0A9D4TZQ6_CHLVU|nr:hypothetical protein D9Q98_001128 [Chlorella vulgaris]
MVLNAAPPVCVAVQVALLGRYSCTPALAAFAAVNTCVGFVRACMGFLIDSVSSKVGRAVGQQAWDELGAHVRLSVHWSLTIGVAAAPLLLAARTPMCSWLLALSSEVQQELAAFWILRSLLVPFQLCSMAAAGVLQGFGHVRLNAVLTSSAALLEMGGSAALLMARQQRQPALPQPGGSGDLVALGCLTFGCQVLLTVAALACAVSLPPPEAHAVNLPREVLGLQFGSGHAAASSAEHPLLACDPEAEPGEQGAGGDDELVAAGGEGAAAAAASTGRLFDEQTKAFLRDGLNLFIRSVVLQLTFFLALAAASRLGTATLAAHSIIAQLWIIISYAVDGFAAAGIVLGSRLVGAASQQPHLHAEAKRHLMQLVRRVLLAGAVCGCAAGLVFTLAADRTISAFTSDPAVAQALRGGAAWEVLAASQPLNGLLFVFDGLLLTTHDFTFIRNNMCSGGLLVFLPLLAASVWWVPSLASIWLAKAALNVWRLAGAAYLLFWRFLPTC